MTFDLANFTGNVHGGVIPKNLDQVAYACAGMYARNFVLFSAAVNYTGRALMEIGILVDTTEIRVAKAATRAAATLRWWQSTPTVTQSKYLS